MCFLDYKAKCKTKVKPDQIHPKVCWYRLHSLDLATFLGGAVGGYCIINRTNTSCKPRKLCVPFTSPDLCIVS